MQKVLVIQTAFIGDVVLSTALLESLHQKDASYLIDVLVRKGNESLLSGHPFVNEVIVWDKKKNKYRNWLKILFQIRHKKYDVVINVQRFAATGIWTAFSNSKTKIGFDKNPFSFLFTHVVHHEQEKPGEHEIDKNHKLLEMVLGCPSLKPKLYPTQSDFDRVAAYQSKPYICIAPASVWFTKQFPIHKWIQFVNEVSFDGNIYILGGPGDIELGEAIINGVNVNTGRDKQVISLVGQLSFLASAALQKKAVLNFVNDSAPMHFASAMNAPVVAIYCSTIPAFGFGPLSDHSFLVQTNEALACRPCGVHGKKACPLGHFNCAETIEMQQLFAPLSQMAQH